MSAVAKKIDAAIGANIRKAREASGLSQEAVAKAIRARRIVEKYTPSQLSRAESGEVPPKPHVLVGLAVIFGCEEGVFFEGVKGGRR